ncbi:MAG: DUF4255 domain-containing protein [Ardenticatenales bacterium]|nr:DUF4255 domain-containing protein [Ardenticatenales bacterium]
MFDKLDEALRKLLIRELPISNNEIDIDFKQPKREWSARLSRPTLNLFLYDVRENNKMRQAQPFWDVEQNGKTATLQRKPVMINLHYVITAWATEPEDEHRLLGRTLMTLYRHPYIPKDLLPEEIAEAKEDVIILKSQYDMLDKPSDIWSTIDNQWRPSIPMILTTPLMPFAPVIEPVVREREVRVGQIDPATALPDRKPQLSEQAGKSIYLTIAGQVRLGGPVENLRVRLLEMARDVEIQPNGQFAIGKLRQGDYTLEVSAKGYLPKRRRVTIPTDEEVILDLD